MRKKKLTPIARLGAPLPDALTVRELHPVPAPTTSRARAQAQRAARVAVRAAAEAEGWTLETITPEEAARLAADWLAVQRQLPPSFSRSTEALDACSRAVWAQLPQWRRRGRAGDPAVARATAAETMRLLLPLQLRLQRQAHAGPSPSPDGGR